MRVMHETDLYAEWNTKESNKRMRVNWKDYFYKEIRHMKN